MSLFDILSMNAAAAKKYIDTLLKKKQDALTFDTIPTADSKNPVTSNGIKKAIDACPDKNGTGARGTWPISVGGSSAIATKAKQDADGNVIPNTYVKRCEELVCTLDDLKIGGSYAIQTGKYIAVDPTYTDIGHPGSVLVIMNKANGATNSCTQIYTTYDTHNSYKREYDAVKKTWSAWRKYAFEDSTVAKAQKLATARKINITGNASGSVTFDGSGDVSINTTVNSATKATSWGAGTSSLINDIATVNNSDTWIPVVSNGKLQHTEKLNMKVGAAVTADKVNDAGRKTAIKDGTREPDGLHLYQCYDNGYPTTYGNVISIGGAGGGELLAGWSGADKGIEHLYYRNRRDAGALWSDWRTVAFTSDINSYAPTKTGTGASGTWGINITGNAATATSATTAGNADASAAIYYLSQGTNYIKVGSADTGDAANKTANMVIGSWYGITFYDVCDGKIAGGMNVRDGSLTMKGTITGSKVYNAVYNDYAEFFEKDENIMFEAGDIVALDTSSEEERYIKATEDSIVVVGVCTHEYAHIIGGKEQTIEENEKEFVPISLMGRVYVKVDGTVKRGDKIAASSVPGIGRKAMPGEHSIGTALTNPYNGKARVLINL